MSRIDSAQALQPSILDRLIDPDSAGTSWRQGYSVEQMIDAVRRDLEDLLNTRRSSLGLPQGYPEVQRSPIAYGLPDLISLDAITIQERAEIGRVIEAVIAQFEPRLKDVKAVMLDPGDANDRSVRYRIDARLRLEPAPDVSFDTILELTTGHTAVKSNT